MTERLIYSLAWIGGTAFLYHAFMLVAGTVRNLFSRTHH